MRCSPAGMTVRPLLMAAGKQVGAVGMARGRRLRPATGCVKLEPNKPVTVAFLLSDESAASLRVVVQDPATDAELYRSPTTSRFDLECEPMSNGAPRRATRSTTSQPPLRRQGRPQGPRPQGEGRRERAGVRPRVPARQVLRVVRRRRDPDGHAGRQRHAGQQLHPRRRVDEGAGDGQGPRAPHLHRQGEGAHRRLGLLGRGGQLRPQERPHPRALRPRLRAPGDGRRLGAGRHALRVRRGDAGKNPFWIDKLTPIQIATFDLEEYRRGRASSRPTSGSTSWCAAWATSRRDVRRLKLLFLVRLIPLASATTTSSSSARAAPARATSSRRSRRTRRC
jgi:hypothetical protein